MFGKFHLLIQQLQRPGVLSSAIVERTTSWDSKTKNLLGVLAYLRTLETEGAYTDRYRWKRELLIRLYELGMERETIAALFQFIEWIMKLPEEMDSQLIDEMY